MAGAVLAGGALAWLLIAGPFGEGDDGAATRVVTFEVAEEETPEIGALGFPLVASRNTTRVGGADPTADAAAVALATHPPAEAGPVEAAVLVPDDSWEAGVCASVLAGPPLRAPILVGSAEEVPDLTASTLERLDPRGSGAADPAAYRVGEVRAPEGLQVADVEGSTPAEIAAGIDKLRGRLLGGEPEHVVIASEDDPPYAMPAAAWAARSGDPVLFSRRDELPEATAAALRRHPRAQVYVLGPESVISDPVLREIARVAPGGVQRVGADGPVANAIEFARYADGSFGWNINDPGHGFVVASSSRPLDAGAAAALSASGKWGPLLVTDSARELPTDLRSFLLDVKPGFRDDPTRAVYNHIWLIGDTSAISASVQAEIDVLAELSQVGAGAGGPAVESQSAGPDLALPGGTEDEPAPRPDRGSRR